MREDGALESNCTLNFDLQRAKFLELGDVRTPRSFLLRQFMCYKGALDVSHSVSCKYVGWITFVSHVLTQKLYAQIEEYNPGLLVRYSRSGFHELLS